MKRKTPVRHTVCSHKRKGKWVRSFTRGTGQKSQIPRKVVRPTHYEDKYGVRRKIPTTTRGLKLKVAHDIRGRVERYARRMGLDPSEIKYKYKSTGRPPAHMRIKFVRPSYEVIGYVLEVNTAHFGGILTYTPNFYDHYMDYMVAHELGHMKHIKEVGVKKVEAMPTFMDEDYADEWAYKVSGRDPDRLTKRMRMIEKRLEEMGVVE